MEGAGAGGAIGGTLGAIIEAVAAIRTSLAILGLGIAIAGPIAAALAGAGASGLNGGVIGALVAAGIPKTERNSMTKISGKAAPDGRQSAHRRGCELF
jgi:hypothetical protein